MTALDDENVGTEGENGICILELNPLYAILSSSISFYVPCVAMLCIYYRLHRYARRQVESIKMTYKCSVGGMSQPAVDDDGDDTGSPLREARTTDNAGAFPVNDALRSGTHRLTVPSRLPVPPSPQ